MKWTINIESSFNFLNDEKSTDSSKQYKQYFYLWIKNRFRK